MREAHNSFRTSFLLHSLNPVFLEIYRAHGTASFIVYRFSSEAQDFFNDIEDRVRIGVAEIAEAIIVESGDEDDSDDEREPIKSPIGTKFIDQLELDQGEKLKSSVVSDVIETLTRNGLGAEKKGKVSKTKSLSIFFEKIPSSVNKSALEELGISFEFYQHHIYLPVSVAFNIERHMLELHPNAKEIKEHVKRNNHLPSNDS
uniref:Uncharacterized protein n=1 Tax=Magallana gigas TaxID=29159 RepID=A0A8W8IRL8_MAGGI